MVIFEKPHKKTPKKMRHVGFEIECFIQESTGDLWDEYDDPRDETYGRTADRYIAEIKEDGSLISSASKGGTGLEFITQPLLNSRKRAITAICKAINSKKKKGYVNKTCGGHIHVNVKDLEIDKSTRLKDIVCALTLFEPALFAVTGPSRLINTFCNPITFNPNSLTVRHNNIFHHRYASVNFQSVVDHGSLEFRCFAGTINPEKWLARAALSEGIVNTIAKVATGKIKWTSLIKHSPFESEDQVLALLGSPAAKRVHYKTIINNKGEDIVVKACKINRVGLKFRNNLLKDHCDLWKKNDTET